MTTDVLVIVNLQEGFRGPDSLSVVPPINKLIKSFENIVHCEFYSEPGDHYTKRLNWSLFDKEAQHEAALHLMYRSIEQKNLLTTSQVIQLRESGN